MKGKFNSLKKDFFNQFNNTIKGLEEIIIDCLKKNNNEINIEGVCCNAPNYDDDGDEPFMIIEVVTLEKSNDGESIWFNNCNKSYSVELEDLPIETLFTIVEQIFEEIE
jgi:hypothetical protein